jgi:hypothetical protein
MVGANAMADQTVPDKCMARLRSAQKELAKRDARFREGVVRRVGRARVELSLDRGEREAYLAYLAPRDEEDSGGWQFQPNKAYSGWDLSFRRVAGGREAWVGARGPQALVKRFIEKLRDALDACLGR